MNSRKERFISIVVLIVKRFRDPYYNGFAAQLSFFFVLSLFPIIIIITRILGSIFSTDLNVALGWLVESMGGGLSESMLGLLTYNSSGALNVLYVVIALWAASRAAFSMGRIFNYTLTNGESTGNGFWHERLRSLYTMFLLIAAIIGAVVVVVYGGLAIEFFFPGQRIWLVLRWPISLGMFFLVISFIYVLLPTVPVHWKSVLPGAFIASLGLVLVTFLYASYINFVAQYDIIYGTLSSVVALLFWFYFMAWVLCTGVMFNKALEDTKPQNLPTYD